MAEGAGTALNTFNDRLVINLRELETLVKRQFWREPAHPIHHAALIVNAFVGSCARRA
jgi:hypothetical protein